MLLVSKKETEIEGKSDPDRLFCGEMEKKVEKSFKTLLKYIF